MGYATDALYDKPSVLIGRKGTINKVKYIEQPFWTVDTLFYTGVNENLVIPKFLYYVMSLLNLDNYNEGTTIPSLRTETLYRLEFDIPSLQDQERILSILKSLDDKIEVNSQINKNLLEQVLLIYSSFFSKKPKNGSIGDYCTIKSGFAFKSSWWQESGVKVIKIGSINQDCLNISECSYVSIDKMQKASDFIVKGGDLLIAMTGATIGKFTMVPRINEIMLVNQRVGKFFLGNDPLLKLPFIYCVLKQPEIINEIINRGQGSAQPNISANDIMTIACHIPDEKEIDTFNKTTSPIFEKIVTNQWENQMLSKLRDSLLPKLMSGEIDIENIYI